MAYLNDRVLDNGLQVLTSETNQLRLCSQEPTTYAQATSTFSLGTRASPTVSSPGAGSPSGRQVTVSSISDGSVTGTGTATHWALVDTANSRLLAANNLTSSQAVTNGNVFTLTSFTVRLPAPA